MVALQPLDDRIEALVADLVAAIRAAGQLASTSGKIGIGTTSPYALLSISNSATTPIYTPLFTVASTTGGTSTSTLLTILSTGQLVMNGTAPAGGVGTGSAFTINPDSGGGAEMSLVGNPADVNFNSAFQVGNNGGAGDFFVWNTGSASAVLDAPYGNNILQLEPNGGFVGIGTTTPFANLSIQKNYGQTNTTLFAVASSTSSDGSSATTLFSIDNTGATTFGNPSSAGSAVFQFGADTNAWAIGYNSTDKSFDIASSTDFSNNIAFTIAKGGNVGIGTTTPWGILSLAALSSNSSPLLSISTSTASATTTVFAIDKNGNTTIGNNGSVLTVNGSRSIFSSGFSALASSTVGDGINALNLLGSATTTGSLEVQGAINETTTAKGVLLGYGPSGDSPRILLGNGTAAQNWQIDNDLGAFRWFTPNNTAMSLSIGPNRLEVQGGVGIGLQFANNIISPPTNGLLVQGAVAIATTTPWGILSLAALSSNTSPLVAISTSTASATTTVFLIDKNGNVGLGTTTPGATLTVSGAGCFAKTSAGIGCSTATVAGDIYYGAAHAAGGFDVAEQYAAVSVGPTTPGTIVGLDYSGTSTLAVATTSANMIGIISTNPGLTFGNYGATASTTPLALSGRVPVKVSLQNGIIQVGDRITLSSVPGVGMKAGPLDPSVGIALEPYATFSASSSIMVFVTLQQGTDAQAIADALIGSSTGATTTPGTVTPFLSSLLAQITNWLANAANGIQNLYATVIHASEVDTQSLCVSDSTGAKTCVTKTQLDALLAGQTASAASVIPATSSAPVLSVSGNNPASVAIGSIYNDLGAIITGPTADLNLGINATVDGGATTTASTISINTSVAGTHTIVYSATDQNGIIGYATRTVNVIDPNASTTTASSTSPTDTGTSSSTPDTSATSTPPVDTATSTPTTDASTTTPQNTSSDATSTATSTTP